MTHVVSSFVVAICSQDDFYDDLVQERLAGKKLNTRVATVGHDEESSDGQIVSCVVGSFIPWAKLSRRMQALLLPDKARFRRLFYIMTLGTVEEHRKTGLASSLVRWVESLVQQDPACGGVYLHVIKYNDSAIRFYERLGFYRVEEIPDYYEIDGQKYASYLYAKYYHGNRGHRDFVRVVRQAFMSLLRNIVYWIPTTTGVGGDRISSGK